MTAKHHFFRFTRTASVLCFMADSETRRIRAERYAKRNHTCGKRAVFV